MCIISLLFCPQCSIKEVLVSISCLFFEFLFFRSRYGVRKETVMHGVCCLRLYYGHLFKVDTHTSSRWTHTSLQGGHTSSRWTPSYVQSVQTVFVLFTWWKSLHVYDRLTVDGCGWKLFSFPRYVILVNHAMPFSLELLRLRQRISPFTTVVIRIRTL